jgi:hypothetical protein
VPVLSLNRRIEPQFYFLIVIPTGWSQRHPFFPRTTGKEIFREIWSIDGRCTVCAEHDDRSLVLLATQHFCRREPGGTPSNDDDARRQGCGADKAVRLKPAEPGSDVVDDGADHAGGKRRPDHAEQHCCVRALYQMPVDEMNHGA